MEVLNSRKHDTNTGYEHEDSRSLYSCSSNHTSPPFNPDFSANDLGNNHRFGIVGSSAAGVDQAGHAEDIKMKRLFLFLLAKALLAYGAPSHRIESQLTSAAEILQSDVEFVHLPNLVILSVRSTGTRSTKTYFVRANGRIALTALHRVHGIYRDVLHHELTVTEGIELLKALLKLPPLYSLPFRCFLAFLDASAICALSFGGSLVDMWMSGFCAALLQYLGLNAARQSTTYANVYEVTISFIVSFVARLLSSLPHSPWCYNSITSAGIILILPKYTILTSALELMSRNLFCGSVRIVYSIIYTLFLGFGIALGSQAYFVFDTRAKNAFHQNLSRPGNDSFVHGTFSFSNATLLAHNLTGVLRTHRDMAQLHLYKGCFRHPEAPFWKQPFPWWAALFLVPVYSLLSSLCHLQTLRSPRLLVMIIFSCASWTTNRLIHIFLPGRTDIVSATGAMVIGVLGNLYARIVGGSAFTTMVTGVMLLVPSGLAEGGGIISNYDNAAEQYSNAFALAFRMTTVASGVTIGLFVSQVLVYMSGTDKQAAHMAF